jgi:tetratricopeptide (TPR) repeat protein
VSWWAPGFLVVAASLLVYLNAIPNGFVLDDIGVIAQNQPLLDATLKRGEWLAWFARPYSWGVHDRPGSYRPVTILSHVANLRIFGLDARSFHGVNVLLHAGVALLVFALGRRLLGRWAAFLGALLFAVHPLHTEAVTGVVGRAELLAAFFGLAALLCALRAIDVEEPRWITWGAVGVALFALGLLSKEHVATLPVWLLLAILVEQGRPTRRALGVLAAFAVATVAFLGAWWTVLTAWGGPVRGAAENNPTLDVSAWVRWLTAARVGARYALLFLWPARLSADYSYAEIVPSQGLGLGAAAGTLLVVAVLAVALIRADRFGLVLALVPVTFALVSNFPFAIGTIMGERLTYLPSVGACLAAGWALTRFGWPERLAPMSWRSHAGTAWSPPAPATTWRRSVAALVCVAAVVGLGTRTIARNRDWHDQLSILEATRATSPRSVKVMLFLAREKLQRGQATEAEPLLVEALRLGPQSPMALWLLGYAQMELGRPEEAIASYKRGLEGAPDWLELHHNLALAQIRLGRPDLAMEQYRRASLAVPDSAEPRHNLAILLWSAGDKAAAEGALRDALRVKPDFMESHLALGGLLLATDRPREAAPEFSAALRLNPREARALLGLSLAAQRRGDTAEAEEYRRLATAAGGPQGRSFFQLVTPAPSAQSRTAWR